jgi:hypothetical protein
MPGALREATLGTHSVSRIFSSNRERDFSMRPLSALRNTPLGYNPLALRPDLRLGIGVRLRTGLTVLGFLIAAVIAVPVLFPRAPAALVVEVSPATRLLADGRSIVTLRIKGDAGRAVRAEDVQVKVLSGSQRIRVESVRSQPDGAVLLKLRAGVLPGAAQVEIRGRGFAPAHLNIELTLDVADSFKDGTPDFLRLDAEADRLAFRRWFVFLAESQFGQSPDRLPMEISDCSALVRFAYREALREHSAGWAEELRLPQLSAAPSVKKYSYPFTPLGASLFRVRPGAFREDDLANGFFAQFADAKTLQSLNTHFVSREVDRARAGDLLFYRQLSQELPFHVMIFLERSERGNGQPEAIGSEAFVVYHTGPTGKWKGEIRRLSLGGLLNHPSPRWRPLPGNSNFLGIYRWNILREEP